MNSIETDIVIKVEQLSKLYRLGTIGTGSLRQDLQYWWNKSVLKKENSFFELDEDNINGTKPQMIWALQNINCSSAHVSDSGNLSPGNGF